MSVSNIPAGSNNCVTPAAQDPGRAPTGVSVALTHKGVLVSISGGMDMTLFEVDEAATRIREEVYDEADIVVGAIFDRSLDGTFRVSVVATGLDSNRSAQPTAPEAINGQTAAAVPSRTLQ